MIFSRVIEISPLAYMRGRTFKNSFIIADEMQNSSPNQMKMLLTRIGENSRMIITGDLTQTDRVDENGLKDFIGKMEKYPPSLFSETNIRILYFNNKDIQRHKLVENILNIYEYEYKEEKEEKKIVKPITNPKKENTTNGFNKNNDCAMIPKEWESPHWSREIGLK